MENEKEKLVYPSTESTVGRATEVKQPAVPTLDKPKDDTINN